jgi:transposase-like protein
MQKPEIVSLYELLRRVPDEDAARQYLENKRWAGNTCCPHCDSNDIHTVKNSKPMPYRCRDCRKFFSVRTGTMLEESRIPLHKWFVAIYLMGTARKGISSIQLGKELGITQKSAWFLMHRIRQAWEIAHPEKIDGEVEVDETYIGGKEKNKHSKKKLKSGRGSVGKMAVVGIMQRNGVVIAKPIASTSAASLQGFIRSNVVSGSNVYTDNFKSYNGLTGYYHQTVNHSVGEYVNQQAHTNGIESFWALLKRGYFGIFHQMSFKHLFRYVNEFAFRHNTRLFSSMEFIERTYRLMRNKKLTYKELIHV